MLRWFGHIKGPRQCTLFMVHTHCKYQGACDNNIKIGGHRPISRVINDSNICVSKLYQGLQRIDHTLISFSSDDGNLEGIGKMTKKVW